MRKQQSGFTLVEIAIVLVIIGLLLGGVLKGQELITQARIKNVANDLNGMTAAVYAYQDRFKQLPGNDTGAAARWGAGVASGDGVNGIGGAFNSATAGDESRLFWLHLRRAGFIAGDNTSSVPPVNAVGGVIGVQQSALGIGGASICLSELPAKIASAIDIQFDNDNPNTGTVRAVVGIVVGNAPVANTAYTDDGSTLYTLCKQL